MSTIAPIWCSRRCGYRGAKEISMAPKAKTTSTIVLRLLVGLALLGWARVCSAQGTWSVISRPPQAPLAQKTGEVAFPGAMAVDATGSLYVAGSNNGESRIQRRDPQANWPVIA